MDKSAPLTTSESLAHSRLAPKLIFFTGVGLLLSIGWLTGTRILKEPETTSLSQSDAMVQDRVREIVGVADEEARKLQAQAAEAIKESGGAEEARKLQAQAEEARKLKAQTEARLNQKVNNIPLATPARGQASEYVHLAMQVLVSIVLLAATLFVVLSKKYDAKDKHWAYGTVGLVIGFWLNQ
jgi:molecular chaperone DnaK (HSP70)